MSMKELPFYEEIVRCSQIVLANKKAIFHVYQSKKGDILKGYLSKIAEDCVGRYVEKEAAGYDLTESDKRLCFAFLQPCDHRQYSGMDRKRTSAEQG